MIAAERAYQEACERVHVLERERFLLDRKIEAAREVAERRYHRVGAAKRADR